MKANLLVFIFLFAFASSVEAQEKFQCLGYIASEEEQILAMEELKDSMYFPSTPSFDSPLLTKREFTVLKSYTSFFYKTVNKLLRKDTYFDEFWRLSILNTTKTICSALTKLPKLKNKVLFRVVDNTPELAAIYEDNTILTEKSFISTAMDMKGIKRFLGQKPNGSHILFTITTTHGKDISSYSGIPKEREALIPAGLKFRVKILKQAEGNNPLEIALEEIN